MDTSLKQELLTFVKKHNDGSEETSRLITKLKDSLHYVDLNAYSLCPDDLMNCISEEAKKTLRKKLGKDESEPFTLQDCETVSEWLADMIEDEFSENLHNAIIY